MRPDAVSARVTARATGQPVEVEALRDEFSSTWVNPDGTWTTRNHAGQQRFRDASGAWRDVDLNLTTTADGSVVARGHPAGLKLRGTPSSAGEVDLVSVQHGAAKGRAGSQLERSLALGWGKKLPAPALNGPRATYAEVAPGVDLVVEARRSGFEQLFVLKDRSAVPAAGAPWSFTVKTKGLRVRPDADGGLSFVDAAGAVASRIPPALAWDAKVDERSGDPVSTSPVRLETATKGNKTTITVAPDAAWLTDPARVFPVTVDPTYAVLPGVTPAYDAFVQSGISSDQSGSTELKLGTYNGGAAVARSFLRFPMASWQGLDVTSASLNLYATHSYSCSARDWQVWTAGAASTATNWANQPAGLVHWYTASATKGYSASCAPGWVQVPVTNMARGWAAGGAADNTVMLRAASETDS